MDKYKKVMAGAVAATVLSVGLTGTAFASGGLSDLKQRIQDSRVQNVITEDFNSSLYDAVKESTAYTSDNEVYDEVEPVKEKTKKDKKSEELKYYEHEVTKDDTIQDLAEDYNVTEESIMEVNDMIDSELHPGDVIYIPDETSQKKG